MKKTLWFSLYLFFTTVNIYAQTPVSFQFDVNGNPINGYLDEISYQTSNPIKITHNSESFESGVIYTSQGEKKPGLIDYKENKIFYKKNDFYTGEKLKPEEINGLTIGLDTFFVINNFYYNDILRKKSRFAQYLTEINGIEFIKYYDFVNYGSGKQIKIIYLARKKGTEVWHELSDKFLAKYLGIVQEFEDRLENNNFIGETKIGWLNSSFNNYIWDNTESLESLKENDEFTLIKKLEYLHKYVSGEPIYFDSHWNEIHRNDSATHMAKISDITHDFWELHYYIGDEKKYEVQYSSLFPHERTGVFKVLDKGVIIKEVTYQDNKITHVKANYSDNMLYEYEFAVTGESDDLKIGEERKFTYVKSTNGNDLLKGDLDKTIKILDPMTDLTYTNTYQNGILKKSYREEKNKKIYQPVDTNYPLKTKRFQSLVKYIIETELLRKTIAANAQGTLLIKLLIKPNGKVEDVVVYGSLHSEFDNYFKAFLDKNVVETGSQSIKFKPYKIDQEKVYLETYIPIVFTINKFYSPPSYHHYYDWSLHNSMIHQQMMMQNSFNHIQAPTF